jgi:pilus assembly protein CpaF
MAVECSIEGTVKTLLVSGRTITGKTTLLQILTNSIPENEHVLLSEDAPELQIRKPNIVAVESPTSVFKTNVSFDGLLKDTLFFRPDWIISGEVRGIEARTLVDSSTPATPVRWRSSTPIRQRKHLRRFANLGMRSHTQTTCSGPEAEIGEAVDFVVLVERQLGRRVVREVLALRGYDRGAKRFLIEPIFEVQHAAT